MPKKKSETLSLSMIGSFPSHWQEMTLSEACTLVTDGTHDSPKEVESGHPLVTGKAIKNRRINFDISYNISLSDHEKVMARSRPERGDILFANIGNSIGDLVRVQVEKEFSIKNVALFKPDPKIINSRYLEFYLFSNAVQSFVKNSTKGSAQPFLGLSTLRGFPVPVPPMDEQLEIARILGSLDDKIENNRQANQTLEAIAQAIFTSWFVDFEPVKVKAAVLAAGGSASEAEAAAMRAIAPVLETTTTASTPSKTIDLRTIAAAFPGELVESELGLIPKGWEPGMLGKLCSQRREGVDPTTVDLPYVGLEHIDRVRLTLGQWGHSSEIESNKSRFSDGDILFGKLRPYFHKVCRCPFEGICSTDILAFSANETMDHAFVALALFSEKLVDYVNLRSTGTRMPRAKAQDILEYPIPIPSSSLREYFDSIISPTFGLADLSIKESHSLAALRDILLPRLLGGEVPA